MSLFTLQQIAPVPSKVAKGTVRNNAMIKAIDRRLKDIETLLRNGETNLALDAVEHLRRLIITKN